MNLFVAFIGGIITFISPCVLPLIPVYLAYITGISVNSLKDYSVSKPFNKILINSIFFVTGFAVVFSLLAAVFFIFIQALGPYKIWFNRLAGLVIIAFGFQIMGLFNIPFINNQLKFDFSPGKKTSMFSSFIMGSAFGAGWTPCIGPILAGIIVTGANGSNIFAAILMLIIFSIGLGIPIILSGLIMNRLVSVFNFLKNHYRVIEIVSGIFLVLLGLILMLNLTGYLSAFLSGLLPNSGEIERYITK